MDGFKNIEIKNFRGIDHLKIDDFSRVNILLGQNSSGKSSVLECLLLMMGMSNPDLPQTINSIRSRNYSGFADLTYIFHRLDLKTTPEISSELFDNTKRHLSLDLTYVFDEKSQPDLQNGQIPTSETKTPPTLTIPAKKTKIYAYLETLLGKSKTQKKQIKDANRNYENTQHWNLDAEYLEPLKEFLNNNLL